MGNRACGGARIVSKVFRFCCETDKGDALPLPKRLPSARLLEAGLRAGRHRASPKTALARPPVIFPPLSEELRCGLERSPAPHGVQGVAGERV